MNISARRGSIILLLLFFLITPRNLRAQFYGNEWVDASKLHLKIPIVNEGVYRLGYFSVEAYFTDANQFMSTIPFNQFRMFRNGKEVPMYVFDQNSNNRFDPFDYVDFVGHLQDGVFDNELYVTPANQTHAYQSIVTDTNYYFFTWRSTGVGLRYSNYTNASPPATPPRKNHRFETVFYQALSYHNGSPLYLLGSNIYLSEYSAGEGFCGAGFPGGSDTNKLYEIIMNTPGYDSSGSAPWMESGLIGSSLTPFAPATPNHRVVSHVGPSKTTYRRVGDTSWAAMGRVVQKFALKPSDLGVTTHLLLNSRFINGIQNSSLHHTFTKVSYPRFYDLDGGNAYTYSEDTSLTPFNVEWSDYGTGSVSQPLAYDEVNLLRISGTYNSGTGKVKYTMPALSQKGLVTITDQTTITEILQTDCRSVWIPDYSNLIDRAKSYLMITSSALYNGPKEEVKNYANNWSTRYNVSINIIEDLYNAFSYGIPHPLAIRHFSKFLLDKSTVNKPQYLLLIGRGFEMSFNRGSGKALLTPHIARNHIPAIGTPVSDQLYTSGLNGTLAEPAIPTGRIPADVEEDVGIYTTKLKGYLNNYNSYEEWQKNILHLGGGTTPDQLKQILDKLNRCAVYPVKDPFAGRVFTYSKAPGAQVDDDFRASIVGHINSGVNLITFLGHASNSVTDIDVGKPEEYLNENKYPICYFNGCQVGNPCLPLKPEQYGLSEKMFRADRKGAVAFMGQTSTSELQSVSEQMVFFYKNYFDSGDNKTLGKVIQSAIKQYQVPASSLNRLHCQQLFLQGDPALPIYSPSLPDFAVSTESVFLDPPNTIALQDSFRVGIIIKNFGKGVKDSFDVNLNRIYPGGATQRKYYTRWKLNGLMDTVFFTIRSKDKATAGNNIFDVSINAPHNPVEFTYDNNQIAKTIYLPANGVNLILPARFAIVGRDTVDLVVQKSDLFKESEDFYLEIDTTPLFNSPVLQSLEKTQQPLNAGVLATWRVKLPVVQDTQQYFWRARINVPANEGGTWNMNSFTYIKGHGEGWMQNLHWQYRPEVSNNSYEDVTFDSGSTAMKFARKSRNIYIDCECGNASNRGVKEGGFGATDLNFGVCKYGLVAIPWDGRKLRRKPVDPNIIGPDCYPWGRAWTTFGNSADYLLYYAFDMSRVQQQDSFVKFINALEDSMYVTIYSRIQISANTWKTEVLQALNSIGSTIFDTASNRRIDAYWLGLGRKGWQPGQAQEVVTFCGNVNDNKYIQLEGVMYGDAPVGSMWSENIGPTNNFRELDFRAKVTRDMITEADELNVDVFGIGNDGSYTSILSNETTTTKSLSHVNTKDFKFLKLRVNTFDTMNHTTPQLLNWRVVHDSVPEGTLYPELVAGYQFHSDTLYEGDTFYLKLPFKNISKTKFRDSILLTYNLSQKISRQEIDAGSKRFTALRGDSIFYFIYKIPTKGLSGPYGLQISVNPQFAQPEKTLVNNTSLVNFYVQRDVISPMLDVTFDGRHILNGDIVSANPVVMIMSKDENQFMWQKDTSTFDLFLRSPGSNIFEKVEFGSEAQFFAATSKDNKARIEYRPLDLEDGTYTLKVQSRDANQNAAGKMEYEIDFNVIREQTITHFYPYPNPFTSNMKFVFTLTGTDIPDEINVKIMTAEGRVVKELRKEDLGQLRVGNNITDWSWDGTDQYGDKLGNGTYFFKVTVKTSGEEVKLRPTKGDSSFKDQVGVIYLMR